VFEELLTRNPPPPSTVRAGLPAEFDHIVAKALEKDREVRYQTAADLGSDLKRARRSSGTMPVVTGAVAPPQTAPAAPARRRPVWHLAAVAAVIAGTSAAVVFLYSSSNRTRA